MRVAKIKLNENDTIFIEATKEINMETKKNKKKARKNSS